MDNITSYKKQKEVYAKRQKPTTELSKKMKSVDEKLNDLFARMYVSLTSIATFAAEISSLIKMENLIYKVNKRISQQK